MAPLHPYNKTLVENLLYVCVCVLYVITFQELFYFIPFALTCFPIWR